MIIRHTLWIVMALAAIDGASAGESFRACLSPAPVPVVVSFDGEASVPALLQGGIEIPLSVVHAESGRVLWSAGTGPGTTQQFDGLDAAFLGSLVALDLDSDGRHDRIYAGDMVGRLWRFDLQHGAPASRWAAGGIFADFGNDEGRGFVAAPDVSLSRPEGAEPWLTIAVGSAAPGNAAASNRFYVLRDYAVHQQWTRVEFEDWQPLQEADLLQVIPAVHVEGDAVTTSDLQGWFMVLGAGHVVTPSITVNHKIIIAVASAPPGGAASCEVFTRIVTVDPVRQRVVPVPDMREWASPLERTMNIGASFHLTAVAGDKALCSLGDNPVAACNVDMTPRRTWWRRDDAE